MDPKQRSGNTRGTSSMDYRERGSHARGVYPTQYTSRMETARVKQEEGADTKVIVKEQYEIWKEGTWALKGEKSQTRPEYSTKAL